MNVVTFQKHLNAEDNTRKFVSLHLRDCSIKNGRIGLKYNSSKLHLESHCFKLKLYHDII